jgi:hypothetical protein
MIPTKRRSPNAHAADRKNGVPNSPRVLQAASWGLDKLIRFGSPGTLLFFGLLLVALFVWTIRAPSLRAEIWPWIGLLAGMFIAADALAAVAPGLPDRELLPANARASGQVRLDRRLTAPFIGAAILTAWVVLRLWPNYQNWSGTLMPWLLALVLVLLGSRLLGTVSGGSPHLEPRPANWQKGARGRIVEIVVVVLILLVAVFLRVYRLDAIPPGIAHDESDAGLAALSILEGQSISPFSTSWYDTPSAFMYYLALVYRFAGATWLGLKLASLIPALLTLPAVYLLARESFGATTALCAMVLLAVSRWHLTMSRWAWNALAVPLLLAISLYFLLRALRLRRALDYCLSGLFAGLMAYTYVSSRLAVLVLLLYVLYWMFSEPAGAVYGLRRRWLGLLVLGFTFVITVTPLAVTYVKNSGSWSHRTAEVTVMREIREQGSLGPLALNVADIMRSFHQWGDTNGRNNLPGEPMMDPFTGGLFAVGLAYSLLRWRDHRSVLLILWVAGGLAGAVLTLHSQSPQAYRSFLALPAAIMLSAWALVKIASVFQGAVRRALPGPRGRAWTPLAGSALAILIIAAAGVWEASKYFGPQARSKEVIDSFAPDRTGVAREAVRRLAAGETLYLWGGYRDHTQLRFLVYGLSKSLYGRGSLSDPPYLFVDPAWDLPLVPDGHAATILYEPSVTMTDYLAYMYPGAKVQLVTTAERSPLFTRAEIPSDQVAGLSGLVETQTLTDGSTISRIVPNVHAIAAADIQQVVWNGALRILQDGKYSLIGHNGLRVIVEGEPWQQARYLARGTYRLRLEWQSAAGLEAPGLLWQTPEMINQRVPDQFLVHLPEPPRGLRAQYFYNPDWLGLPAFSHLAPFVQLSWPTAPPVAPDGVFSVRLSGLLRVPESRDYTFRAVADDGLRFFLDGQLLGEGLVPHQANSFEIPVTLQAGDHPIRLDYVQYGGASQLQLLWSYADRPLEPVPPSALIPTMP